MPKTMQGPGADILIGVAEWIDGALGLLGGTMPRKEVIAAAIHIGIAVGVRHPEWATWVLERTDVGHGEAHKWIETTTNQIVSHWPADGEL